MVNGEMVKNVEDLNKIVCLFLVVVRWWVILEWSFVRVGEDWKRGCFKVFLFFEFVFKCFLGVLVFCLVILGSFWF